MYIHKMYLTSSGVRTMAYDYAKAMAKAMKESLQPAIEQPAAPPNYTHCFRDLAVMRDSSRLVVRRFGLKNLNRRCYANASIQLLRSFPPVHNYFLHKFTTTDIKPDSSATTEKELSLLRSQKGVLLALRKTFLMLQFQLLPSIGPWQISELMAATEKVTQEFVSGKDEQANRFTLFLIDVCNNCLDIKLFKDLNVTDSVESTCSNCNNVNFKTGVVEGVYPFHANETKTTLPAIFLNNKSIVTGKKCGNCLKKYDQDLIYRVYPDKWFFFTVAQLRDVYGNPNPQKITIPSEIFGFNDKHYQIVSFQMYTALHYVNVQMINTEWVLFDDRKVETTTLDAINEKEEYYPCEFLCRRV